MTAATQSDHPFRIHNELKLFSGPMLNAGLAHLLEHASGLRKLEEHYQRVSHVADSSQFLEAVLQELGTVAEADELLSGVPSKGRLIVVANHPYGAIEGILLSYLLLKARPDVKVLANYFLQRIPQLQNLLIGVDPFAGINAARRNSKPLRESLRWLQNEGVLLVFPSGTVSHWSAAHAHVVDPAWSPTIGRLIRLSKAPVLPVFVPGRNSLPFQVAGLVHPKLRTMLIPRQLLNKRGTRIAIRAGTVIPYKRLETFPSDAELVAHLRLRTYTLTDRESFAVAQPAVVCRHAAVTGRNILEPVSPAILAAEVAALPASNLLLESGELQVYCAQAEQILWLMREIGRLRELTFRQVGEGTGNETDIDLFDAYYLHLFVWDTSNSCVVGAYRLGMTDVIFKRFGRKGLYTHSLFKFRPSVLSAFTPALELGRSFVRQEYQRSFSPLLLLWKGIATFVAKNPQYHLLFGPVSISAEYRQSSRQMLVDYLRANSFENTLSRYVIPRHPFRSRCVYPWNAIDMASVPDIETLSDIIAGLERDHKGVPVLLKQYLKLGGRILGFNVDHNFNNVLDGLILVDLRNTDPKVLSRYMGTEALQRFLDYHHGRLPLQREAS